MGRGGLEPPTADQDNDREADARRAPPTADSGARIQSDLHTLNATEGEPPTRLRPAGPGDVDTVARIKVTGWSDAYSGLVPDEVLARHLDLDRQRDSIRALLASPDSLLLVAEIEGDGVVGFAATRGAAAGRLPLLESLHVLPGHRGRGLGSALLRSTAAHVSSRGCGRLSLHVVEGNVRARRLYERLGGRLAGLVDADWANGAAVEAVYVWDDLGPLLDGRDLAS